MSSEWMIYAPNPSEPRKIAYKRANAATRIVMWPDYSSANPYQRLLYSNVRQRCVTYSGTIDSAMSALTERPSDGQMVFHLHWLNALTNDSHSPAEASHIFSGFIGKIDEFKRKGGKVIWTIHNLISHDAQFPAEEIALGKRLLQVVDRVHLHSDLSIQEVESVYGVLPRQRVRLSSHGNYVGYYPNFIAADQARHRLGLNEDDHVLLFFGQVRPYKGIENLIRAIGDIATENRDLKLVVAGKSSYEIGAYLRGSVPASVLDQLTFIDRFFADSELQLLFNAADFAVLPYQKVLTSGSMMLSLSFGVPVIVPDTGMTREVLGGVNAGFLYASGDDEDMARAVRCAVGAKLAGELSAMKKTAWETAARYPWPDFVAKVYDFDVSDVSAATMRRSSNEVQHA
jgi:O-antigen biosynthesis protein